MKCAVVCDTPYQLYNAIRLKLTSFKNDNADLFVVNKFTNCEILVGRIKAKNIFNRVYLLDNKDQFVGCYKYELMFNLSKILENFLPKRMIQKWTNSKEKFDDYDRLLFSLYMRTHIILRMLNPNAEVCFFDDGTGSYNGTVFPIGFKLHKLLYKILHRFNDLDLKVKKIFLNYPEMATYRDVNVERIIDSAETSKMLKEIFDPQDIGVATYQTKKFIYLTQPNDENISNYRDNENRVLNILNPYSFQTVIRPHPRLNKTMHNTTNISVDTSQVLWEYIAKNICSDDTVLIGAFSTAQFTPKLLFNKEPYLIFLFMIMGYDKNYSDLLSLEVEKIKKIYKNPSKIYVPINFNELRQIVNKLSNGHEN